MHLNESMDPFGGNDFQIVYLVAMLFDDRMLSDDDGEMVRVKLPEVPVVQWVLVAFGRRI